MKHRATRVIVTALLWAAAAQADIAPPPGYVEPCSVEKQKRPGEDCVSCSTYFGAADACQKQHASRGYALRCKTRGASTWTEVWCKASSGAAVSSLNAGQDAGGATAPEPPPTASASAAPPPSATAPGTSTSTSTSTSTPPTPAEPTSSAAPVASSAEPPATRPAPGEKSGGCGACALGAPSPSRSELAWLLGAAALAATRLRARSRRA